MQDNGMINDLPLAGVTVVSVEQAIAAPLATRLLADYGARVVKIERPVSGDFARAYDSTVKGLSSHFVWVNRSKQSLTLDLRRPESREVVGRLLSRADAFVQNLAPGAADRLGLGSARLRDLFPRLVVCSISGYGSSGPYKNRKAYDLLVQCETGLVSVTGTPDTPCKVGISVADIAAGMYAAQAILLALFRRQRNGQGATLEVSLFDALADWMGFPAYYAAYAGAPARTGSAHSTIAPYGPFKAGDGRYVYLGVQNEIEWSRFCESVLKTPALANDPRFDTNSKRAKNREPLRDVVEGCFAASTKEEVLGLLTSAGIACASLNSVDEFLKHPQLTERGRFRQVGSPVGDVMALLPPVSIEGVTPVLGAIPAVGEHTAAILAELGFPSDYCSSDSGYAVDAGL